MPSTTAKLAVASLGALALATPALAQDLPQTLVWTAYGMNSGGYAQAAGIGSAVKSNTKTTLRILPGKNDLSRMVPVREGKAHFAANGLGTYMAQEAAFEFAHRDWGPQAVRSLAMSIGDYCMMPYAPADLGVETAYDLKGQRVAIIKAAPALNYAILTYLRFADLTWDDVERVEFAGSNAAMDSILNGQADIAFATTASPRPRSLEASSRGLAWPTVPHDDEAGWARMKEAGPYYVKHTCTEGAGGISPDNPIEGATYPYPILMTYADHDADLVYAMTKTIYDLYDAYKDSAPGANGWALDRQELSWVVPVHEGAIRYYEEAGVWNADHQANTERQIERQAVLQEAWDAFLAGNADLDEDELRDAWVGVRHKMLQDAGFPPVWDQF